MQRSLKQNSSIHKYYEMLSESLNEAGLDMRQTLRNDIEIPWTPENVKNHLWRPVQKSALGKQSTTELTKAEISRVYDILHRHLVEKLGVDVPFPSQETYEANIKKS